MIKWVRDYVFSTERDVKEKRFSLVCLVAEAAIISVIAAVLTSQEAIGFVIALVIAAVFIFLLWRFSYKKGYYEIGSKIVVLLTNVVILPVGYLLGGGAQSGAPTWPALGIMAVFVLFRGPDFFIYLLASIASFGAAVYLGMIHPEWVIPLNSHYSEHLDIFVAASLVGIMSGALFYLQGSILEKEVSRAEEQTKEIENLNQIQSNFFASMSHEIRTPISTIIGLNEMNMREKDLPLEVVENTHNIQNASKMLLSLINDLLDMSKIQSEKMEIVPAEYDTSRMLSDITNLHWNRAIEKELRFDIQVGENIPPLLYGDETRIKQIITNLLTNAIKYTEEGSVILRFGGEYVGTDKFILNVEVQDTGIGIRKEDINYLFDTFRRVEGSETKNIEGTGLGLAISKQLADLMGGTLTVDSIYTKGSVFRLQLPQGVVRTDSAASFKKPGVLKGVKDEYHQSFEAPEAVILVVDDNDMNRMVCKKLLRDTKMRVDTAKSGKECLELTAEKHYDVILMDHEMPQMDGIETLRKLRQQPEGLCRNTPVIALTANAGSDREAFYMDQGFSAYLSKPIQSSQLEALLMASLPVDLIEKKNSEAEVETLTVYDTVHKIPFAITTDSICDLPEDVMKEMDIQVMPYYIETTHGRFRDLNEIDADNLRHFLRDSEHIASSDPAPIEEYENFFGNVLSEARFVLHLSSSKIISNAYDHAFEAAKSFDNVMVLDTGLISGGLGMMAVKASEMFKNGMRLEETLEELERYKNTIRLCFLVPSLSDSGTKYKIGRGLKFLTDTLNFEPVFTVRKGRLHIKEFLLGYIRSTEDQFVHNALSHKGVIKSDKIYVVFSGYPIEKREHLIKEIEKCMHFDRVIVNKASAATYANIGPNSVGLIYQMKDPE